MVKEGVPVPLQIGNISFTGVTRSTTPLSSGDIGIFRLVSLGYVEKRSNVQYTNSSGSGWDVASGADPIYLKKSNASLCVYSPYIGDKSIFTNETLTLSSQIYTESADFCYQTGVTAVSGTPISFILGHAYAKLVFNLTCDDTYIGDCAISKISIANDGIMSSNTLDIGTGSYGSGTAGMVTVNPEISSIASGSTVTVAVLMVPTVTTLSGEMTLTFTVDGEDKPTTVDVSTADLTSLKSGNDYVFNVTINKFIPDISTTANCYMIAPGNRLEIPVNVRGNGRGVVGTGISTSISPLSVGLLWETSSGLISLGDMSTDKKITITTNSASGNAVIAAYSGANQTGDILWSWHIWVTDYDPNTDTNGTTHTITNTANVSYTFMDRNLGATTATPGQPSTLGLLYQWGRKDPFPGARTVTGGEPTIYNAGGVGSTTMVNKAAASSLANAILHPLTFYTASGDWCITQNDALWGGALISAPTEKTIFDPSPVGWRVPAFNKSKSPWDRFNTDTFPWSAANHGRTYSGVFYPATGYRNLSTGALIYVGSYGYSWSGSPLSSNGYTLLFSSGIVSPARNYTRAYGFAVQCVRE